MVDMNSLLIQVFLATVAVCCLCTNYHSVRDFVSQHRVANG